MTAKPRGMTKLEMRLRLEEMGVELKTRLCKDDTREIFERYDGAETDYGLIELLKGVEKKREWLCGFSLDRLKSLAKHLGIETKGRMDRELVRDILGIKRELVKVDGCNVTILDEDGVSGLTEKDIVDMDRVEVLRILRGLYILSKELSKSLEELLGLLREYKETATHDGFINKIKRDGVGVLEKIAFEKIIREYIKSFGYPGNVKKCELLSLFDKGIHPPGICRVSHQPP